MLFRSYHDVWSVLYRLQTDKAFAEKIPIADNCGGVLLSGGGRVLLRASSASSGGDNWTFAKTPVKHGESPQDTALRAVREKTGYAATIRGTVPGVFKGSSSSTRYFLMEASHPPVRTMAQTALRWVRFDEARELIRQSKIGRAHV